MHLTIVFDVSPVREYLYSVFSDEDSAQISEAESGFHREKFVKAVKQMPYILVMRLRGFNFTKFFKELPDSAQKVINFVSCRFRGSH